MWFKTSRSQPKKILRNLYCLISPLVRIQPRLFINVFKKPQKSLNNGLTYPIPHATAAPEISQTMCPNMRWSRTDRALLPRASLVPEAWGNYWSFSSDFGSSNLPSYFLFFCPKGRTTRSSQAYL